MTKDWTKDFLSRHQFERCFDVPMQTVPTCQTYQSMIFSAFRYALRRHTYIVGTTVDYIINTIDTFDKKWLELMRREIKEYLDWHYSDPKNSGEFDCDVEKWEELLNAVMTRQQELG